MGGGVSSCGAWRVIRICAESFITLSLGVMGVPFASFFSTGCTSISMRAPRSNFSEVFISISPFSVRTRTLSSLLRLTTSPLNFMLCFKLARLALSSLERLITSAGRSEKILLLASLCAALKPGGNPVKPVVLIHIFYTSFLGMRIIFEF